MATAPNLRANSPLPFRPQRNPLVLWHVLSLDAPTVAVLWTWFLARTSHVHLPWTSLAAMAATVWLLYAADRLLDARDSAATLEARHRFHHRHRVAFRIGIGIATVALAGLLPRLPPEAIRLYLIEGSFLAGYFLLIHTARTAHRIPKELAVGLFFAAATFIPTVSRQPNLRAPLIAPALLFAALCSLNCLYIYDWEHPSADPSTHPITQLALQHLRSLTIAILCAAVGLAVIEPQRTIPAATALSALLLLSLHHSRHRIRPTMLRAAADAALLTPIFFLPWP